MSSIYGVPNNLLTFATTSAMTAFNVDTTVDGNVVQNGELVQVNTVGLFQYQKYGTAAVDNVNVFAASPVGQWVEYFTATGQNYICLNGNTNNIINKNVGAVMPAAGTATFSGGSSTATFTIPGMVNTDILLVQISASTNAVNVQKVSHSGTTATVVMSADPGAGTTFVYQLARVVS